MASLEKRDGIFRVDFRFGGRRYRRSLKTDNERSAVACLARLEDNLHRLQLGTLSLPHGADVAEFLLSDGRANGTPRPQRPGIQTLGELCDKSMKAIPLGSLEQSTIDGMEVHMRHLRRHLRSSTPLTEIGLSQLQDYVNRRSKQKGRRGRKIQPATIKKEIVTLRGMWNWAVRTGGVTKPFPRLKDLRYPKAVEKPPFQTWKDIEARIAKGNLSTSAQADLWDCVFLTLAEIDELLQHVQCTARHQFLHPMFVFAAHTGARRSELIRSRIEDVNFTSGLITIREKKRVRGKLTTRTVPLTARLRSVLEQWFTHHPDGSHTFCIERDRLRSKKGCAKVEPLTRNRARTHFGITLANSKWEKLRGWHIFRHSYCSNCAAAGIDERTISSWVGHQTEEMARRYRHLFPNKQQEDIHKVFGTE